MPADPAPPSPLSPLTSLSDEALLARLPPAAALPDAPAAWRERAVAAWRAPAPSLAGQVTAALQRLHAVLSFDSWATAPLAAGLRAAGPAHPAQRQLVFSAEGRDVDLRISAQGAAYAIRGQVLGPDDAGLVSLAPAPDAPPVGQCPLDELGEFHLGSIAPGRYTLSLRVTGHEILLPAFEVGAAPAGGAAAG